VKSTDDASGLQLPNAFGRGVWAQIHTLTQVAEAEAPLFAERTEDFAVNVIDCCIYL
jgi:hypothetical protein